MLAFKDVPVTFDSIFPRSALVSTVSSAPLVVFGVLITLFLTDPSWQRADLTAFAAVGLLVGLPHGAVDLFLELGPRGVPRGRALVAQLVLYVVVVAVALALTLTVPLIGVGVFIAISVWHFGSAEAAFNACRRARLPRIAPVETIAYGTPLAMLPFVRWPEQTAVIVDPLGGHGITAQLAGPARVVLVVAVLATVVTLARKAWLRHGQDAFELSLLWTAALVLPPLAAFSVYFALWHAPRHVLRTLPELPANQRDLTSGVLWRSLLRYGWYTLPGTLGAFALFGGLLLVHNSPADLGLATWAGAFLAALTMPHAVAIFRYDLWLHRTGSGK